MSSFTKPLIVSKINNGSWKTYRRFTYYIDYVGGDSITVPKGFITDFASIPRMFWIILPPDGEYTQAAVLHDYLYFKQSRSRKEADQIFLDAMGVLEVPNWKRYPMYHAVRMFGWIPWRNHKKRNEKSNKVD